MNNHNGERKSWAARSGQQGYDARYEGRFIDTCPYPLGGTLSRLWREGWHRADHELKARA